MDGIAGLLLRHRGAPHAAITRMQDQLRAACGGGQATWVDPESGALLGYRRCVEAALAGPVVVPTASASGRWIVALNGRLYDHHQIRQRMERAGSAQRWRGSTEAETLAEAIDAWGFDQALAQIPGQFAIAAWDRSERCLWLARDRLGEKSLYYGWLDDAFVFASELRPIRAFDGGRHLSVSQESLALLASLNYVPAPWSIFQQISRLAPGCRVRLNAGDHDVQVQPYWTFPPPRADLMDPALPLPAQVRAVDEALRAAIRRQMSPDLATGALLSGGIDSSLVVALLQAESNARVKTFTIGFEDAAADESPHAREISRHLGTKHHELMVTSSMAMDQIPRLPALLDEPLGDSSQIPTLCVLGFARQHVAVVYGGDGADELFGGYGRYRKLAHTWRAARWVPSLLRQSGAAAVTSGVGDVLARFAGSRGAQALQKARYYLPRIAYSGSERDLYYAMLTQWARVKLVRHLPGSAMDQVRRAMSRATSTAFVPFMMETDALTYLPDDVMVKVDRAAMSCALETRAPFLDHEVVELSSRIPLGGKLGADCGKVVLRECLAQHVPRALFERPKHGFNIPLDLWLRGPLRDWAESLLERKRLDQEGHFHAAAVRAAWEDHLAGRASNGHQLWSILMFQAWLTDGLPRPARE